uniref:Uncharacterized protein n=1 Tax=Arundo donax TaxID=35708 RepID=A0A0A8Z3U1_ARUDO
MTEIQFSIFKLVRCQKCINQLSFKLAVKN